MRRRNFFLGLAGLGALGAVGGWRFARTTPQEAIMTVLRKRLDYLILDEAGMRRFAADMLSRSGISSLRLRALSTLAPLYNHLALTGHDGWLENVRHGEERLTTMFLLSSDFFRNGRQEKRTVHYLAYYDPLQTCTSNPFARPVTPGPAAPTAPAWPAAAAAAAAAR